MQLSVSQGDVVLFQGKALNFDAARAALERVVARSKDHDSCLVTMKLRFSNGLEVDASESPIPLLQAVWPGRLFDASTTLIRGVAELEGSPSGTSPREIVYLARSIANQWALTTPRKQSQPDG